MREPTLNHAKNLYDLLEVSPTASPSVIQAAYHVLARTWHPDVNNAPEAARRIRDLNAAYHILSSPERRARYDLQRMRASRRERVSGTLAIKLENPQTAQPAIIISPTRSREPVAAARLRNARNLAPRSPLPVYSPQAILMIATIAALVGAVLLLLWVGLILNEEVPHDFGQFVEVAR